MFGNAVFAVLILSTTLKGREPKDFPAHRSGNAPEYTTGWLLQQFFLLLPLNGYLTWELLKIAKTSLEGGFDASKERGTRCRLRRQIVAD